MAERSASSQQDSVETCTRHSSEDVTMSSSGFSSTTRSFADSALLSEPSASAGVKSNGLKNRSAAAGSASSDSVFSVGARGVPPPESHPCVTQSSNGGADVCPRDTCSGTKTRSSSTGSSSSTDTEETSTEVNVTGKDEVAALGSSHLPGSSLRPYDAASKEHLERTSQRVHQVSSESVVEEGSPQRKPLHEFAKKIEDQKRGERSLSREIPQEESCFLYVQIIGPGMSGEKASNAERVGLLSHDAPPVPLVMTVRDPGEFLVLATATPNWNGRRCIERETWAEDSTKIANFFVRASIFEDAFGKRLREAICNKCRHTLGSRKRTVYKHPLLGLGPDDVIKLRLRSHRGEHLNLVADLTVYASVPDPSEKPRVCNACTDTTSSALPLSRPNWAHLRSLVYPPASSRNSVFKPSSSTVSGENHKPSSIQASTSHEAAKDSLSTSFARLPVTPEVPAPDELKSSKSCSRPEVARVAPCQAEKAAQSEPRRKSSVLPHGSLRHIFLPPTDPKTVPGGSAAEGRCSSLSKTTAVQTRTLPLSSVARGTDGASSANEPAGSILLSPAVAAAPQADRWNVQDIPAEGSSEASGELGQDVYAPVTRSVHDRESVPYFGPGDGDGNIAEKGGYGPATKPDAVAPLTVHVGNSAAATTSGKGSGLAAKDLVRKHLDPGTPASISIKITSKSSCDLDATALVTIANAELADAEGVMGGASDSPSHPESTLVKGITGEVGEDCKCQVKCSCAVAVDDSSRAGGADSDRRKDADGSVVKPTAVSLPAQPTANEKVGVITTDPTQNVNASRIAIAALISTAQSSPSVIPAVPANTGNAKSADMEGAKANACGTLTHPKTKRGETPRPANKAFPSLSIPSIDSYPVSAEHSASDGTYVSIGKVRKNDDRAATFSGSDAVVADENLPGPVVLKKDNSVSTIGGLCDELSGPKGTRGNADFVNDMCENGAKPSDQRGGEIAGKAGTYGGVGLNVTAPFRALRTPSRSVAISRPVTKTRAVEGPQITGMQEVLVLLSKAIRQDANRQNLETVFCNLRDALTRAEFHKSDRQNLETVSCNLRDALARAEFHKLDRQNVETIFCDLRDALTRAEFHKSVHPASLKLFCSDVKICEAMLTVFETVSPAARAAAVTPAFTNALKGSGDGAQHFSDGAAHYPRHRSSIREGGVSEPRVSYSPRGVANGANRTRPAKSSEVALPASQLGRRDLHENLEKHLVRASFDPVRARPCSSRLPSQEGELICPSCGAGGWSCITERFASQAIDGFAERNMKCVPCSVCLWSAGDPLPRHIKGTDARPGMTCGSASERAQEPGNEGGRSFSTNRRDAAEVEKASLKEAPPTPTPAGDDGKVINPTIGPEFRLFYDTWNMTVIEALTTKGPSSSSVAKQAAGSDATSPALATSVKQSRPLSDIFPVVQGASCLPQRTVDGVKDNGVSRGQPLASVAGNPASGISVEDAATASGSATDGNTSNGPKTLRHLPGDSSLGMKQMRRDIRNCESMSVSKTAQEASNQASLPAPEREMAPSSVAPSSSFLPTVSRLGIAHQSTAVSNPSKDAAVATDSVPSNAGGFLRASRHSCAAATLSPSVRQSSSLPLVASPSPQAPTSPYASGSWRATCATANDHRRGTSSDSARLPGGLPLHTSPTPSSQNFVNFTWKTTVAASVQSTSSLCLSMLEARGVKPQRVGAPLPVTEIVPAASAQAPVTALSVEGRDGMTKSSDRYQCVSNVPVPSPANPAKSAVNLQGSEPVKHDRSKAGFAMIGVKASKSGLATTAVTTARPQAVRTLPPTPVASDGPLLPFASHATFSSLPHAAPCSAPARAKRDRRGGSDHLRTENMTEVTATQLSKLQFPQPHLAVAQGREGREPHDVGARKAAVESMTPWGGSTPCNVEALEVGDSMGGKQVERTDVAYGVDQVGIISGSATSLSTKKSDANSVCVAVSQTHPPAAGGYTRPMESGGANAKSTTIKRFGEAYVAGGGKKRKGVEACEATAEAVKPQPVHPPATKKGGELTKEEAKLEQAILNGELLHLHFRWSEGRPRVRREDDLLSRLYLAEGDPIIPSNTDRRAPTPGHGHPLPFDALFPDYEERRSAGKFERKEETSKSSGKVASASTLTTRSAEPEHGVQPNKRMRHQP